MITIKKEDIDKLEKIGRGGNGTIYKVGSEVYKIYRKNSRALFSGERPNPSLKYRPLRLHRLISIGRKIKYTDLIQDTIFVDGKFAGVVMPFYNGMRLCDEKKLQIEEKIRISQEIVRNAEELTDYFIYPMDYKLNNILLVGNHPKLIDLDDWTTKVKLRPHLISSRLSIETLDETIKTFLNEYRSIPLSKEIREKLSKNPIHPDFSYRGIKNYLKEKSKIHNYIFVSESSDLKSNLRLLRDDKYRVILSFKESYFDEEHVGKHLEELLYHGIDIYDIIGFDRLYEYAGNLPHEECMIIDKTHVKRI